MRRFDTQKAAEPAEVCVLHEDLEAFRRLVSEAQRDPQFVIVTSARITIESIDGAVIARLEEKKS